MARQEINIGAAPTGAGGDTTRSTAVKINAMTQELYSRNSLLGSASNRNVGLNEGNVMEVAASAAVVGNSSFALDGSRFISHLDGTTTGGAPGAPNAVGIRSRFADNSLWAVDIVAGVYQTAAGLYWRQVNASGVPLGWRQVYDTTNTTRAQDGTLKAI